VRFRADRFEFMLVSLLTPMADDLHVTEGLAGQGITISGAFAVLTSLSIPWLREPSTARRCCWP
jgi:predicted MFS family arabinose efflux permease